MFINEDHHANPEILGPYLVNKGSKTDGNDFTPRIYCNIGTNYPGLTKAAVKAAINEMGELATKKSRYFAHHLQISPDLEAAKDMTDQEIQFAIDTTMEIRGWKKGAKVRPHVATIHTKDGRQHIHLAVQGFNPETRKMDPNKKWARDHAKIREVVEDTLGWRKTREEYPYHEVIAEQMTALWATVKKAGMTGAQYFKAAMEQGYLFAWGGAQRPLQVIDPFEGQSHNLTKKIVGFDGREVYEKLRGEKLFLKKDAVKASRAKIEADKRAEKKRIIEEQKVYSPDSRPAQEVVELDISKKQDAFLAAISLFKEKDALAEEKRRIEAERLQKVKEAQENLDELFERKKTRKRGLSL